MYINIHFYFQLFYTFHFKNLINGDENKNLDDFLFELMIDLMFHDSIFSDYTSQMKRNCYNTC